MDQLAEKNFEDERTEEEEPLEDPPTLATIFPFEINERLLCYLDFYSLIQLSYSSKVFCRALAVHSRFRNYNKLRISGTDVDSKGYKLGETWMVIKGLKYVLPVLRIFGEKFKVLAIDNSSSFRDDAMRTMRQIRSYAENIQILDFINVTYDLSQEIRIPFFHVTEVSFKNSTICRKLCNLILHFPNLNTINLCGWNYIESPKLMLVHYPHLTGAYICTQSLTPLGVQKLCERNPNASIRCFDKEGVEVDYRDYL